jgi:hypothetical protein
MIRMPFKDHFKGVASLKGKGLSHQWQIVLAFFLGGAVSSIAQDPSDTLFFLASSQGPLSTTQQVWYWYFVSFLLYFGFFMVGFILAKATDLQPVFFVYFFAVIIILSTIVSLALPQNASYIYLASVLLGTFVSIGIVAGLAGKVKNRGGK